MKKNIKRIVAFLLALLSVSMFFSCGKNDDDDGKLSVICTMFAPYDFAREIAGDTANVTMLVPPGSDTHSYDPTPRDVIAINKCDVFIYGGGESDTWVEKLIASAENPDMKIIKLIDCTEELYYEEHKEGMTVGKHDHDDDDKEYDEHVWTSPRNAVIISEKIAKTLCELSPENAEIYNENFDLYKTELEKLDAEFKNIVSSGKRKEVIFGDRFPLLYFVKAYGLDYYAAFPGCAGETEPSGATVAFLINKVKDDGIPVVFYLELSEGKIASTICESTGAEKLRFNACHNVSKKDFENGVSYLSLMRENAEVLKKALG